MQIANMDAAMRQRMSGFSDRRADFAFFSPVSLLSERGTKPRRNCACRRPCSEPYFPPFHGRMAEIQTARPSITPEGNAVHFSVADPKPFSRLKAGFRRTQ